jgi:hypothetical protein
LRLCIGLKAHTDITIRLSWPEDRSLDCHHCIGFLRDISQDEHTMQPERQHSLVMLAIRQETPIRRAQTARVDATSTAHPFHTIVPINHHKHIIVNVVEFAAGNRLQVPREQSSYRTRSHVVLR